MILSYYDEDNRIVLCNIEEAVEREMDAVLPDTGQVEANSENITALSSGFGKLIAYLHRNKIIDDEFLLSDLLQSGYDKTE